MVSYRDRRHACNAWLKRQFIVVAREPTTDGFGSLAHLLVLKPLRKIRLAAMIQWNVKPKVDGSCSLLYLLTRAATQLKEQGGDPLKQRSNTAWVDIPHAMARESEHH